MKQCDKHAKLSMRDRKNYNYDWKIYGAPYEASDWVYVLNPKVLKNNMKSFLTMVGSL